MAGSLPVFSLNDFGDFFMGYFPGSHVDQRPGNDPDHVVEESVSSHFKGQDPVLVSPRIKLVIHYIFQDLQIADGTDGGFHFLSSGSLEAFEIVGSLYMPGCQPHGRQIQLPNHLVGIIPVKDIPFPAISDFIQIGLS